MGLGAIFGGGKASPPPPPLPPPPPPSRDMAMESADRRRASVATGRKSTILTPQGEDTAKPNVAYKTLLGQ